MSTRAASEKRPPPDTGQSVDLRPIVVQTLNQSREINNKLFQMPAFNNKWRIVAIGRDLREVKLSAIPALVLLPENQRLDDGNIQGLICIKQNEVGIPRNQITL
ncbi:MAG: hypothetical protein H0W24_12285 [Lysobacter sp.]|jgi:hypothetical protein|nr:hypothetical protein [Lysobacter sp.]MBA3641395.1 hypothetical protein [Acidobacteriota bacterium]